MVLGLFSSHVSHQLKDKTAVITGADHEVGREIVWGLAKEGARVIICCKEAIEGEEIASKIIRRLNSRNLVIHQLDTACFDSVRKFVDRVSSQEERIDLLINAEDIGIKERLTKTRESRPTFKEIWQTHYLGHFLLTKLLFQVYNESKPKVINLYTTLDDDTEVNLDLDVFTPKFRDPKSKEEPQTFDPLKAYKQSKLANILFTKELNGRYGNGTSMACESTIRSSSWDNPTSWGDAAWNTASYAWNKFSFWYPGAKTVMHCVKLLLTETDSQNSSQFFRASKALENEPEFLANIDNKFADEFWKKSEEAVEETTG